MRRKKKTNTNLTVHDDFDYGFDPDDGGNDDMTITLILLDHYSLSNDIIRPLHFK